jgi:hypothetical protein
MPPEAVLRHVSKRLLNLIVTGGTTGEDPFEEGDNSELGRHWQDVKNAMVDDIIAHVQQQESQGMQLATFWGRLLPATVEVITCDVVDTRLREHLTHDALALAHRSAIRLAYPEEYLLQYLAAQLLDGVDAQSSSFEDVLVMAYYWANILRGLDVQMPADEWLLQSLSTFLDLPQAVLLGNMQRDDLVYTMFCREVGKRETFDIPRDETNGQPSFSVGDLLDIPNLTDPRLPELNALLSRSDTSPIEITEEIARVTGQQTPTRGELTRRWRRDMNLRRRRRF